MPVMNTGVSAPTAPPYHVQSTARTLRDGFPCFAHHDSVSALWSHKWRVPCAAGIYPFTDGRVEDFDPVFAELSKISADDPAILYRPDDYAKPFFPVAEQLVAAAQEALSKGGASREGICSCARRRSAGSRGSPSTDRRSARKHGRRARPHTSKAVGCSTRRASRSASPSRTPTRPQAISTPT